MKRIITTLALFFSVIMFPWYVTAPCVIAAMFYFSEYYEALAAGFLFDALYGVPLPYLAHTAILGSFFFFFLFFLVELIKPRLRFYIQA